MRKTKTCFILSVALLFFAAAGRGEARDYYTWCKSFSTGENLACTTQTEYGGAYAYTPGTAPAIYNVPDNKLFNVRYEAPGHETALFSMYLDSKVSSCVKGSDCHFSHDGWETRCVWNGQDAWVCTIDHQAAKLPGVSINQYYLQTDYSVRNYRYLAPAGNSNSPPIIAAVPAMSFPENAGALPKIVDLWFYTGDDRTSKPDLTYSIVSQTNPGVVSCSVVENRYIDCLTQPSANGTSEITFSVKDAGGATASSPFSLRITPVKSSPGRPQTDSKFILPSTPAAESAVQARDADHDPAQGSQENALPMP